MRLVGLATVFVWALMAPASAQEPANAPSSALHPQKSYSECVPEPERYLALSFQDFDQGVRQLPDGSWQASGWREIDNREGCGTAAAMLISQWRERHGASLHPAQRGMSSFHEGQVRAAAGDYAGAIPLIEAGRSAFGDAAGQAYVDAVVAFLRSDRAALIAARERLLGVPEPANWAKLQRTYKEAGAELKWPRNIEETDRLVRCLGRQYGECR